MDSPCLLHKYIHKDTRNWWFQSDDAGLMFACVWVCYRRRRRRRCHVAKDEMNNFDFNRIFYLFMNGKVRNWHRHGTVGDCIMNDFCIATEATRTFSSKNVRKAEKMLEGKNNHKIDTSLVYDFELLHRINSSFRKNNDFDVNESYSLLFRRCNAENYGHWRWRLNHIFFVLVYFSSVGNT